MTNDHKNPKASGDISELAQHVGHKAKIRIEGFPEPLEVTITSVQVHERLPNDHPVYALVGRIAAEWAGYESILDQIIWTMADVSGSLGASITAQIMGAGPRLVTIRTLASEIDILDKINDHLKRIENKTFSLQVLRNRAIHDPWVWEKIANVPAQHRSKPKSEPIFGYVSIDEASLHKLIENIVKLRSTTQVLGQYIGAFIRTRRRRDTALLGKPPPPA